MSDECRFRTEQTEIWWSTTLSTCLQDFTANSLVGSSLYWVLQWLEQNKKGEREMFWQCFYLTVCRMSIQHTRRCGSTQPSVSCSGDGLSVPKGIIQLMNGSRVQWMGGYQWLLPETSAVHRAQIWNKANFMVVCKTLLYRTKTGEMNNRRKEQKYSNMLWNSISLLRQHIYSAWYMYSSIKWGLLWSYNSFIGNFYK